MNEFFTPIFQLTTHHAPPKHDQSANAQPVGRRVRVEPNDEAMGLTAWHMAVKLMDSTAGTACTLQCVDGVFERFSK